MSKGLAIFLGILFMGFVGVVAIAGSAIGLYNNLASQEEGLKAQYKQNQNNYASYVDKLVTSAQVTDNYADDLRKVYKAAMEGRYGADGSKAVFQMLTEQNPNLDPKLYTQLQQLIEAGRNSFEADQKSLLDKKRIYETNLRTFPSNIVASMMGFPTAAMAEIDIVTSDATEKAFKSKKAEPVQLRKTESAVQAPK